MLHLNKCHFIPFGELFNSVFTVTENSVDQRTYDSAATAETFTAFHYRNKNIESSDTLPLQLMVDILNILVDLNHSPHQSSYYTAFAQPCHLHSQSCLLCFSAFYTIPIIITNF